MKALTSMRNSIGLLCVISACATFVHGQAVVGDSVNPNLSFAIFGEDGGLENRSLAEFENQIVLLYYYAPW